MNTSFIFFTLFCKPWFNSFKIVQISDGLSGPIFTTVVVDVCAVVEYFTTTLVVAVVVFGCLTTAVAVVSYDKYEN